MATGGRVRSTRSPTTTGTPGRPRPQPNRPSSLLGDLFLRSGRICKQPVIVKKVKSSYGLHRTTGPARPGGKGKKRASVRATTSPRTSADIGGGIGIGGVF